MDEKVLLVFGIIAFKLYLDNSKKVNKIVQRKKKRVLAKRAEKNEEIKPVVKLEGFRCK